ncbi:xylulokinase [Paenibacillus sp. SORGH_AS306]|uniref:xylulokinase n=1 Tax=unclassified Paenibacillus TaxID=185978 RepID=UPI002784C25F|nr:MULTISPECIES: xylulokinase [unclassified Paenibacillus]MDQ1235652.1 xylulokinase [Paenibacillus sp. SORGH_AS_0306]MDR6112701.1 xylulokinase [Paenibacillus sp. SORGH_AS_0338]
MSYVIGVDLGTSAVKTVLVDKQGNIAYEMSESYPLSQPKAGYSEQSPEDWVKGTLTSLRRLVEISGVASEEIEGLSFSGQMHGLVLLDGDNKVIRPAILWNDTRTSKQCRRIEETLGDELLKIARNRALEGFTLPKILWVQENEPEHMEAARLVLLPKDYVRYQLTGDLAMDYSDAAGTLLLDVTGKQWSEKIASAFDLPMSLLPRLIESFDDVGGLLPEVAEQTGLSVNTRVYGGGADNACGAIGAGILSEGQTMCSIGTSGVVLSYEERKDLDFAGKVHFFNHSEQDAFYIMGVTLAAGYSLEWFRSAFGKDLSFDQLLHDVNNVAAGAEGLLFTPYIVGERTPHPDADIRGSFIGIDAAHKLPHFARAVLEGITFSLRESIDILRESGKSITSVVSIGGGAKNETWLQMQADIFNAEIVRLENEQGPAMGAAMLAAYGSGWFPSLQDCAAAFLRHAKSYQPDPERAEKYDQLFAIYQDIYGQTAELNKRLAAFRG